MFTRYFYPLNEQEDSCSVHLNGMTDMGHGLLLPRRSLMNTELISGTSVASDAGRNCVGGSKRLEICFPACTRGSWQ